MRFIVDECTGSAVARWLQAEGHDVYSVYEEARGLARLTVQWPSPSGPHEEGTEAKNAITEARPWR